jgi:hypothetical protein
VSDLSTPQAVMTRLAEIENDLALRQNLLEQAALNWYRAKRDKEKDRAVKFLASEGTVAERQALADQATAIDGKEEEALYESLRAVVRTLETRATIGMAILKAQKFDAQTVSGPQPSWTGAA